MTTQDSVRIDDDEVRKIANLAMLALSDEEMAHIGQDLNAILGYVDKLNELDVDGVEPTTHAIPLDMPLREDVVAQTLDRADVLANAPATEDGMFQVPRSVEGGN